jgi:serine O-acetyltransferase
LCNASFLFFTMTDPTAIRVPQEVVNDTSVRVVRLLSTTGQQIMAGQTIAELETSKSVLQVEAPASGWLQVLCKEGDDLPVGGLIGQLYKSEGSLQATLQPTPVKLQPVATNLLPETSTATVFSDDARALIHSHGLSEAAFHGRGFVRAADVKALLKTEPLMSVESPALPPMIAAKVPFTQTLAEDWPLLALIRADLHRIEGRHDNATLLHQWWWNPGFNYVFWFRITQWTQRRRWARPIFFPLLVLILHRRHLQSGIRIPLSVKAGPGLHIGHWGGIWINPQCRLGANCTISNDVNAGSAGGASKVGVPQIGDNVYIGPGSRLAGPIQIGQNVAIMPNTLVTADVPPNSIIIGVPHRISGRLEHNNFVSNTQYPLP